VPGVHCLFFPMPLTCDGYAVYSKSDTIQRCRARRRGTCSHGARSGARRRGMRLLVLAVLPVRAVLIRDAPDLRDRKFHVPTESVP